MLKDILIQTSGAFNRPLVYNHRRCMEAMRIMAEKEKTEEKESKESKGSVAVKPKRARKTKSQTKPPQPLPPWKVLLHNDDKNDFFFVIHTVVELTPLNEDSAKQRTLEAHETGVSLLLVTHKERAELYKEQFASKGLIVTIEAAEGGGGCGGGGGFVGGGGGRCGGGL
jgi:ATP-dependent Clp protease adaptor protein ClpS